MCPPHEPILPSSSICRAKPKRQCRESRSRLSLQNEHTAARLPDHSSAAEEDPPPMFLCLAVDARRLHCTVPRTAKESVKNRTICKFGSAAFFFSSSPLLLLLHHLFLFLLPLLRLLCTHLDTLQDQPERTADGDIQPCRASNWARSLGHEQSSFGARRGLRTAYSVTSYRARRMWGYPPLKGVSNCSWVWLGYARLEASRIGGRGGWDR